MHGTWHRARQWSGPRMCYYTKQQRPMVRGDYGGDATARPGTDPTAGLHICSLVSWAWRPGNIFFARGTVSCTAPMDVSGLPGSRMGASDEAAERAFRALHRAPSQRRQRAVLSSHPSLRGATVWRWRWRSLVAVWAPAGPRLRATVNGMRLGNLRCVSKSMRISVFFRQSRAANCLVQRADSEEQTTDHQMPSGTDRTAGSLHAPPPPSRRRECGRS